MDPDRARARIVELAATVVDGSPEDLEWSELLATAEELAECVLALDEWLRRGGFKPTAWNAHGGPR